MKKEFEKLDLISPINTSQKEALSRDVKIFNLDPTVLPCQFILNFKLNMVLFKIRNQVLCLRFNHKIY